MKTAATIAIAIGLLMLAQWIFFLAAGLVPELNTAPVEITFHLVAELGTALALLAAGLGLLHRRPWAQPVALLAFGMLLYTVVNSAGYFAQQQEWLFVGMFAILLLLALFSIGLILRPRG
ncbi:MAG TPA: hypothetical protein VK879_00175 [Candidatus Sulfomarinibacteraceae bacterium]|nr:hypothetical protein [Candidatus Sulfomarinibacteraceae bacterium]